MTQRQLSDPELEALARVHCDMSAARYREYTASEVIVDPDDEVRVAPWPYRARLKFLLMTANYPHIH